MTWAAAATTCVAGDVTLYLALPPSCSFPPLSPGPIASSSQVHRRILSGSADATPGSSTRAHELSEHLRDQRPHLDALASDLVVASGVATSPLARPAESTTRSAVCHPSSTAL